MSEPVTGTCACGAIHYRINTRIRSTVNCHCNTCRQHNGSAFSTYCVVPEKYFELVDSGQQLAHHDFSPRVRKHFCRRCGTPLFNTNDRYQKYRMIFIGTLADADAAIPTANIFCSSQLDWVRTIGEITSYTEALTP